MFIYIILMLSTVLLAKFLEKNINNKLGKASLIILLFFLTVVAGVRTIDIGWDASKYVYSTFYRLNYTDGIYEEFIKLTTVEYGFSLMSYILYKIYPNINFMLFGYNFITTLIIFYFSFSEKDNIKISNVLIIYFFTLYLVSFNIIRQSISVALALLAFNKFKNKKILSCIIITCLTCLFHNSGIFLLFIFLLYKIVGCRI